MRIVWSQCTLRITSCWAFSGIVVCMLTVASLLGSGRPPWYLAFADLVVWTIYRHGVRCCSTFCMISCSLEPRGLQKHLLLLRWLRGCLQVLVSSHKTEGPSTSVTFLGILVDTMHSSCGFHSRRSPGCGAWLLIGARNALAPAETWVFHRPFGPSRHRHLPWADLSSEPVWSPLMHVQAIPLHATICSCEGWPSVVAPVWNGTSLIMFIQMPLEAMAVVHLRCLQAGSRWGGQIIGWCHPLPWMSLCRLSLQRLYGGRTGKVVMCASILITMLWSRCWSKGPQKTLAWTTYSVLYFSMQPSTTFTFWQSTYPALRLMPCHVMILLPFLVSFLRWCLWRFPLWCWIWWWRLTQIGACWTGSSCLGTLCSGPLPPHSQCLPFRYKAVFGRLPASESPTSPSFRTHVVLLCVKSVHSMSYLILLSILTSAFFGSSKSLLGAQTQVWVRSHSCTTWCGRWAICPLHPIALLSSWSHQTF